MDTYVNPGHEKETHRVMQRLEGKSDSLQEAISVWGEVMCESCDACIANEGATLKIGDKCWRCGTPIVAFELIEN